ncbi:hypothetical protein GW17_00000258 [Ensete ventricosum]|nr:hypothetical protein GW17_00000258 [Ensete ventricosum]
MYSATSNEVTSRSEDSTTAKQTSKSSGSVSSQKSIPELYEERAHNLRVFELKELRNATNDFSRLLKIGEGGFGSVYKGIVKPPDRKGDGTTVAIKKLNPQGLQVTSPRDLPSIYYKDYAFVKSFSRLQIALGAAEGLAYLHEGMDVQVIYRDFKASNVLLDEEFRPKLSDFGLAREGPSEGHTHVTTAVMGTYGYAAPDYVETGHLTAKSDVWSFGVVLYEILTGRKSMERHRPRTEQKLLDWVKAFPAESGRFSMIMDPRLENKYSLRAAREVAKLADACLAKLARDRPKMSEVAESLKGAMQYEELDGQVEPLEGTSPAYPESDDRSKTGVASARRRMLHLEKLGEKANAVGRRRFVIMKASNQT